MKKIIVDGCTAAAQIAYKCSQVVPVYPITPSTPMAEFCSSQSAGGKKNIFGEDVKLIEMQSEAGVAGAMHGALLSGALASTFTASQGLLLMIPNLYKIAAEGLPAVIHVASRSVASHALNIFCDHSDVMSVRTTGTIILNSASVQQCQDIALCAHALALRSSTPVLHFFDGFRTSHEIDKIVSIDDEVISATIKPLLENHPFRRNALSPTSPLQYGTAQNSDVFFQNKVANEKRYLHISNDIDAVFDDFFKKTGRKYAKFEIFGNKNAKNVVVLMGSAVNVMREVVDERKDAAVIHVRLYRPFDSDAFVSALPKNLQNVCVLDRTKEEGSLSPLALDVISALSAKNIKAKVTTGVYGLGGKDFTPAQANAVIDNMICPNPKAHFYVGIDDDVLGNSLKICENSQKNAEILTNNYKKEIKIFGLGSDGSVSASKSTIKILGESYDKFVQGYFEYDSKKSGSMTISHLRISDKPILSSYLLQECDVISIGNFSFVHKYDCLQGLKQNGVVIINSIFDENEIDKVIPKHYVDTLKERNAKLYIINAHKIASAVGLGEKINIIMQMALFKATNLLSESDAKMYMAKEIEKTFARKGKAVVEKNLNAMNEAANAVKEVDINRLHGVVKKSHPSGSGEFYRDIFKPIAEMRGNEIPVSKFNPSGAVPTGTSALEKRNIAARLPKWIKENCIQCGQCVLACPHSALRAILVSDEIDKKDIFKGAIGVKNALYKIQLSPHDCTGCGVCASVCPALQKALEMVDVSEILDEEERRYDYLSALPKIKQNLFSTDFAKGLQFEKPYFEFPGACAGCGQTPYIKLASILFGQRMIIANATGCTSIYSGSFPSCPFTKDENGRGPAWANSLFEDNAEFGLGIKLGKEAQGDNSSVWVIGGDGWAYDIGFGGLDHLLASGANVNILVLDNESYSNTGGQSSKATPMGASVKLNDGGKHTHKKNLGAIAMNYPNVYVAQVAIGADMTQCIKAFKEAESHNGPSLILAYSTCVNQGFDMSQSLNEMKKAVECGYWPLYRYDGTLRLDSQMSEDKYYDFLKGERRYAITIEHGKENLLDENKKHAITEYEKLKNKSK